MLFFLVLSLSNVQCVEGKREKERKRTRREKEKEAEKEGVRERRRVGEVPCKN